MPATEAVSWCPDIQHTHAEHGCVPGADDQGAGLAPRSSALQG